MGRCFPAKAPPVADVNDTLTLTRMYGKNGVCCMEVFGNDCTKPVLQSNNCCFFLLTLINRLAELPRVRMEYEYRENVYRIHTCTRIDTQKPRAGAEESRVFNSCLFRFRGALGVLPQHCLVHWKYKRSAD